MFHEAAEICLVGGIDPQTLEKGVEQTISGHVVSFNQEMVEHLLSGLDLIAELIEPGDIVRVEERVWIEPYTLEDDGFGTSDLIIIKVKKRQIIVFDWKYGKIAVSPIENDQEVLYGLGVWETVAGKIFDWDPTDIEVKLIIYQPRVPGGGGEWSTTMEWMLQEGNAIRIDAAATYDPDAPRIPGTKQCHYCKAKKDCGPFIRWNLQMVGLRFEDLDTGIELDVSPPLVEDFGEWTPEHRSYVWLHRKSFISWLKSLGEEIMADYQHERPTPFIKAVTGKGGRRKWKLAEHRKEIETYLAEYPPEEVWVPISPAEMEKKTGKKAFREDLSMYVAQGDPKPMLVPITDTRKALPSKMVKFDELEEDEDDEDGED